MEQDEGFNQILPSHIIAEAGSYREGAHCLIFPVTTRFRTEGTLMWLQQFFGYDREFPVSSSIQESG